MEKKPENPGAFPCQGVHTEKDARGFTSNLHVIYPGMSLLDYFAGQYMSYGNPPDTAYSLAGQALRERELLMKKEE